MLFLTKMNNKKNILMIGGLLIGIVLVVYLASYVIPRVIVTMSKASEIQVVSINESYILGEKIVAQADGKDNCVVNVFVVDKAGRGIPNRSVDLIGLGSKTANTDLNGKASFELTSKVKKEYELSASVGGLTLSKTFKVIFR